MVLSAKVGAFSDWPACILKGIEGNAQNVAGHPGDRTASFALRVHRLSAGAGGPRSPTFSLHGRARSPPPGPSEAAINGAKNLPAWSQTVVISGRMGEIAGSGLLFDLTRAVRQGRRRQPPVPAGRRASWRVSRAWPRASEKGSSSAVFQFTSFPTPARSWPIFADNVVASSQHLAATAGLYMMAKGGNAVDAADREARSPSRSSSRR